MVPEKNGRHALSSNDGAHSSDLFALDELLGRYAALLQEMQEFAEHSTLGHEDIHGVGGLLKLTSHLRGDMQALASLAEKARQDDALQISVSHQVRSSNLQHYEALWTVAKKSRAITDFNKSIQWQTAKNGKKPRPVHLDIVADYGRQWVKISTISQKRLVYEMAKLGWNADSDSDVDALAGEDEDDSISIYRNALDLSMASTTLWAGDRHPKVLYIFTKLAHGAMPQIDRILDSIRRLPNVTLLLQLDADQTSTPLSTAISTMELDPFDGLTETLNMDCTVMLSLTSDLSHAPVTKELWHKTATRVQIEQETRQPILPTWVYPAIAGRRMVCTVKCHEHFRKIVNEIGTDSERARAAILMGDDPKRGQDELHARWGGKSDHDVPLTLQLPIEIVEVEQELQQLPFNGQGSLPAASKRLADNIASQLTDLNSDIFMYGWRTGRTTVTSNFNVTRRIIDLLNKHRKEDEQDVLGPLIWSRAPSRSLIAKEKSSFKGIGCPPGNRTSKLSYEAVTE